MNRFMKIKTALLCLIICLLSNTSTNAAAGAVQDIPDIPLCEALQAGSSAHLSIGVAQPYASPEVVQYAVNLATKDISMTVCSESWASVLPRYVPWAVQLERGYGWIIFSLIFVGVVASLTAFTPRQWWRRTTLVGVLAVIGLTWLGGIAALATVNALGGQRLLYGTVVSLRAPQQPAAHWLDVVDARDLEAALVQRQLLPAIAGKISNRTTETANTGKPRPNGRYGVFHRVNLREGPGIESPRLTILAIGEQVLFDGAVEGDWWRIRTSKGQSGWVSSIWLRRLEELKPPAVRSASPIVVKPWPSLMTLCFDGRRPCEIN